MKALFPEILSAATLGAHAALKPFLRDGASPDDILAVLDGLAHGAFRGIETRERELAYNKRVNPYVEPRIVHLAPGKELQDQVVSFPLKDLLIRDIRNNPEVRRQVLLKSDEWKMGEKW